MFSSVVSRVVEVTREFEMAGHGDDEESRVGKVKVANRGLVTVIDELQKEVVKFKKKSEEYEEELEKEKNGRAEFELEMKRKMKKMEPREKQKEIDDLKEQIKTMTFILNTVTKEKKELKEQLALSETSTIDDDARAEVELELKRTKHKLEESRGKVERLEIELKVERDKCDNSTALKEELAKMEVKLNLQGSQLERANKRVAQVESEKQRLQKTVNEQQKLEAEFTTKVISLEGQVRNAAVKESFHMNLLNDSEKGTKKLKEDLKKALDDKKSYQDDLTKQFSLMTSMRKELAQAKEKFDKQEKDARIVKANIKDIEANYEQEKSTWESTLTVKEATIVDLQGEREKLLAFADNLKKLSQFKVSDSSSSIINELEKLQDHISKRVVVVPVKVKEKPAPKPRKAPARKRKLRKACDSTTDDQSQNEVASKIGSHKKPKAALIETWSASINTKEVGRGGSGCQRKTRAPLKETSNALVKSKEVDNPGVSAKTPLSGTTVTMDMDSESEEEIDVETVDCAEIESQEIPKAPLEETLNTLINTKEFDRAGPGSQKKSKTPLEEETPSALNNLKDVSHAEIGSHYEPKALKQEISNNVDNAKEGDHDGPKFPTVEAEEQIPKTSAVPTPSSATSVTMDTKNGIVVVTID